MDEFHGVESLLDGQVAGLMSCLLIVWSIANTVALRLKILRDGDRAAVVALSWFWIPLFWGFIYAVSVPQSNYAKYVAAPISWVAVMMPVAATIVICLRAWSVHRVLARARAAAKPDQA